jgi:hypothetical protein
MIPLWKGKNPIYFGVITIIPFDNLYRQVYFVMHTFFYRTDLQGTPIRKHQHMGIIITQFIDKKGIENVQTFLCVIFLLVCYQISLL